MPVRNSVDLVEGYEHENILGYLIYGYRLATRL